MYTYASIHPPIVAQITLTVTSNNTLFLCTTTPAPSRPEPREDDVPVEEDAYNHEDLYACYSTVTSLTLMDTFQKYLLDCLASTGRLLEEFNVRRLRLVVSPSPVNLVYCRL